MEKSDPPPVAPIYTLPPEILGSVFASACTQYDQVEGSAYQNATHPPKCMILSHVCTDWRTMVLESPKLWTPIYLSNLTKLPLLIYMMERCQGLPVSVVYTIANKVTTRTVLNKDVFRALLSSTQQLQSLDLAVPDYLIGQVLDQAQGILQGLKHLKITNGPQAHYPAAGTLIKIPVLGGPNLRRLEISNYCLPWNSPLLRHPQLTHVKLDAIPVMNSKNAPMLFDFLRESPGLVSLDLEHPFISEVDECRATARIPLPNLKILKLSFASHRMGLVTLLRSLLIPPPSVMSETSFYATLKGRPESEISKVQALISAWTTAQQGSNTISPQAFTFVEGMDPYYGSSRILYTEGWLSSLPDPLWPTRKEYQDREGSRPDAEHSFTFGQAMMPFDFPLYQGLWSFEDLRLIEIYGRVSLSFWAMLSDLPLLEAVHITASELGRFMDDALPGMPTFRSPTSIATDSRISTTVPPFPALRTLAIRDFEDVPDSLQVLKALMGAFELGCRRAGVSPRPGSWLETLIIRPTEPCNPPALRREMCSGGRLAREVLWERTAGILTPVHF